MTAGSKETLAELRARAIEAGIDVEEKATKAEIEAQLEHHMQANADASDDATLLDHGVASAAVALGIEVSEQSTQAELARLIRTHPLVRGTVADARAEQYGLPGEKRPIEKTTPQGDWLDPFSGALIYHGDDVSPISGARRDGATAVLEG